MNIVSLSGWLHTDPILERWGDLAVCELRLASQSPDGRPNGVIAVTVFGHLAVLASERLAVGDHVGVTGWLRVRPVDGDRQLDGLRVDVVGERLDFLGHQAPPAVAPDAHLEAAYEDRFELDGAS
jgi:single-stranded DNA-binding protein